jgi:hypothetical protein
MSEGKFDAAIELMLRESNLYSVPCGRKRELANAIRVLEAAGKIDKELALRLFEDCYATASVQRYGEVKIGDLYRAIRALLNALPDEVTK